MSLTISLPFPPASLFPNRSTGKHWTTTRKIKDDFRDDCAWIANHVFRVQGVKWEDGDIPITITFHAPDRRRRDRDNCLAAAKHGLDGVAKALGVDDSRFEPLTLRRGEMVKGGKMIMEVG